MKGFANKVSDVLESIIKKEFDISCEHPLWELPKTKEFGDLSSMVALKLAFLNEGVFSNNVMGYCSPST